MTGQQPRAGRNRQSPGNNDITPPQLQDQGPSPRYPTRGSTQHVPLPNQDIHMPDTTFGDFIPINPMFDGDPQAYGTAEGTAGLDTGLYMTIFQGYLEKLALGLLHHMKSRLATDPSAIMQLQDMVFTHMQADIDSQSSEIDSYVVHNGNEHNESQP